LIELLFEIIRPIGNFISRRVVSEKFVEADSILSDAIGGVVLVLIVGLILVLVLSYVR